MSKEIGTKKEVYEEKAQRTKQGLTKDDLMVNAKGSVVKKKKTRATSNKPKKTNPWIEHLREFRKNNPQFSYKDAMKEAKKTYKKGQPAPRQQQPAQEEKKEEETPTEKQTKKFLKKDKKERKKEEIKKVEEVSGEDILGQAQQFLDEEPEEKKQAQEEREKGTKFKKNQFLSINDDAYQVAKVLNVDRKNKKVKVELYIMDIEGGFSPTNEKIVVDLDIDKDAGGNETAEYIIGDGEGVGDKIQVILSSKITEKEIKESKKIIKQYKDEKKRQDAIDRGEEIKEKPPTLAQQKKELKERLKQPEDMTREELLEAYKALEDILKQQAEKKKMSFNKKILKKTGLDKLTPEELEQLSKEEDYTRLLESKKAIKGDKKIVLQNHQKRFIEGFLYSNLKSAIMFHGVGTGKTFSAVSCVKAYLQIYPSHKVHIITPPALLFNFIDSMIDYGIDPRDPRFNYYSYTSFTNKNVDTKDSLMIVDEAHNLRTAITTEDGDTGDIEAVKTGKRPYKVIEGASFAHKVMLLTATPFINKPYDIENLIAIGEGRLSYSEDIFSTMISDPQVRYDYFRYRISKFMNPQNSEDFPQERLKYIPIDVDRNSREGRSIKAEANPKTNPAYVFTRQSSIDFNNNAKVKFVIDIIKNNPNKKYVIYVSFHSGINNLITALEEIKEEAGVISGRINTIRKAQAIDAYNNYYNKDSEYYKKSRVLIITKAGAEGVSLTETRGLFIMDGVWNEALNTQITARAIRYKSHANLPKNERYVEVYKLFACFPEEAKILEGINDGKPFNYTRFLQQFQAYKKIMKKIKKGTNDFTYEALQKSKKGSQERKELLESMGFSKGKAGYVASDMIREFQGFPSTDFYMFVLQKSKEAVIDNLIDELEKIPVLEKIITDMPEVKMLYDMIQKEYEKGTYEGNKEVVKKLQGILNKEEKKAGLFLEREIDNKESKLSQYIKKKKEVSELLKAKMKRRVKQEFFTPTKFVNELIQLSGIEQARQDRIYNVLETSAGWGNIVKGVIQVAERRKLNIDFDLVEIQPENRKDLKALQDIIPHMIELQKEPDFIQFLSSKKYDYVFTNPPFHLNNRYNKQYNENVYSYHFLMRAYAMMKKNGVLVAITGREWENAVGEGKKFYDKVGAEIINADVEWSDDKTLKKGMEIKKLSISFIRIDKSVENRNYDNELLERTNNLLNDEYRKKDVIGESLLKLQEQIIQREVKETTPEEYEADVLKVVSKEQMKENKKKRKAEEQRIREEGIRIAEESKIEYDKQKAEEAEEAEQLRKEAEEEKAPQAVEPEEEKKEDLTKLQKRFIKEVYEDDLENKKKLLKGEKEGLEVVYSRYRRRRTTEAVKELDKRRKKIKELEEDIEELEKTIEEKKQNPPPDNEKLKDFFKRRDKEKAEDKEKFEKAVVEVDLAKTEKSKKIVLKEEEEKAPQAVEPEEEEEPQAKSEQIRKAQELFREIEDYKDEEKLEKSMKKAFVLTARDKEEYLQNIKDKIMKQQEEIANIWRNNKDKRDEKALKQMNADANKLASEIGNIIDNLIVKIHKNKKKYKSIKELGKARGYEEEKKEEEKKEEPEELNQYAKEHLEMNKIKLEEKEKEYKQYKELWSKLKPKKKLTKGDYLDTFTSITGKRVSGGSGGVEALKEFIRKNLKLTDKEMIQKDYERKKKNYENDIKDLAKEIKELKEKIKDPVKHGKDYEKRQKQLEKEMEEFRKSDVRITSFTSKDLGKLVGRGLEKRKQKEKKALHKHKQFTNKIYSMRNIVY